MPRWKQDETEFNVSLNEISGSHICRVPKPIMERLGMPDRIRFVIVGKKIIVTAGKAARR